MRYLLTCFLLLTGVITPVSAHQQKAAITKVLFNSRTDNLEVMHRFYLHDAEHAVREIFGNQADIIHSQKTQKTFSQYVARRFALFNEGEQLPLKTIGFEVDGRFFWVYQETKQPANVTKLTAKHHALRDLWQNQNNMLNFEGKGKVKTLNFDGSEELLTVEFEEQHQH